MPFHPDCTKMMQMMYAQFPSAGARYGAVKKAREQFKRLNRQLGGISHDASLLVKDFFIKLSARSLRVRFYHRIAHGPQPTLVYFHGGGWVLGDLDSHDIFCTQLARYGGFNVVSVNYRLAPEHPFPAAYNDCIDILNWLIKDMAQFNIHPDMLGIGGDQAGANLVASTVHCFRDTKMPVKIQLLINPILDLRFRHASFYEVKEGIEPSKEFLVWCKRMYLADASQASDPHVSPVLFSGFQNLPPTIVISCGYDRMRDDAFLYVKQLEHDQVPVEHFYYQDYLPDFLRAYQYVHMAEEETKKLAIKVRHYLLSHAPVLVEPLA